MAARAARKTRTEARSTASRTKSRAGASKTHVVRFGSVTVETTPPSTRVRNQNIEAGRVALVRASKAIRKPGVKLAAAKGIPRYFADPKNPARIVRVLDGKRDVGTFESGAFKRLK